MRKYIVEIKQNLTFYFLLEIKLIQKIGSILR